MKTLSKTQYEKLTDPYTLTDKLVDISLSNLYFKKTAICAAKSIQHLIPEEHKKVCLTAIETAEKYLRGEATKEECKKVAYATELIGDNAPQACAFAADTAYYAGVYATASTRVTACDILRQEFPWELACATQIAKCFGKENNEQFIQEITKDEKLINYATILLEDENLRKEFKFLMKDYVNK